MKSADLIAAFTAIKYGLDQAIAQEKVETLRVAAEIGVKSFSTPWGQVTVVEGEDEWRVHLDQLAFLAWVEANHPDEVETVPPSEPYRRVKPIFEAKFRSELVRVGASVVHSDSGEVVEFADAVRTPAPAPHIVYPKTKLQTAAKETAAAWVAETAQALTDTLRERTAIEAE